MNELFRMLHSMTDYVLYWEQFNSTMAVMLSFVNVRVKGQLFSHMKCYLTSLTKISCFWWRGGGFFSGHRAVRWTDAEAC